MITFYHIKAARALLGWTQRDLATHSGVALASVANLEQGKGKAKGKIYEAVLATLDREGIEFTPEPGVRLRREKFQFRLLEGRESVLELWDDVFAALGPTGGEVLISGIDERVWLKNYKTEMPFFIKRQFAFNVKPRILIAEGDTFVLVGPEVYRAVPRVVFHQVPFYVYADRFAIVNWGPPQRILLVQNALIAETFRRQFEVNYAMGRPLDPKNVVIARLEKKR